MRLLRDGAKMEIKRVDICLEKNIVFLLVWSGLELVFESMYVFFAKCLSNIKKDTKKIKQKKFWKMKSLSLLSF